MDKPVVFISAATADLRKWRDILHGAFHDAGFPVRAQDHSLGCSPGTLREMLETRFGESQLVFHLAGLGYGADAEDAFPDHAAFRCSWTQYEYYRAHQLGKKVIALVCAPDLSEWRTLDSEAQEDTDGRLVRLLLRFRKIARLPGANSLLG